MTGTVIAFIVGLLIGGGTVFFACVLAAIAWNGDDEH